MAASKTPNLSGAAGKQRAAQQAQRKPYDPNDPSTYTQVDPGTVPGGAGYGSAGTGSWNHTGVANPNAGGTLQQILSPVGAVGNPIQGSAVNTLGGPAGPIASAGNAALGSL